MYWQKKSETLDLKRWCLRYMTNQYEGQCRKP